MDRDDLKRQWEALAAPWIREAREGANPTRNGLLDAPMLAACGDVRGLRVLECGCGEGRFCRLLAQHGAAEVLGLDLCEPMIAAARESQGPRESYQVADVQSLPFLPDRHFDLAVSYLNQCDLPDFAANTREVYRVLKPGRRFIIANLHPMRSAGGAWQKDEAGQKLHVILDHYFDEGERHWRMKGVEVTNFHRSLSTCINEYVKIGFAVAGVVEPKPTEEQLRKYPTNDDELRVPNFIIYILMRPTQG